MGSSLGYKIKVQIRVVNFLIPKIIFTMSCLKVHVGQKTDDDDSFA